MSTETTDRATSEGRGPVGRSTWEAVCAFVASGIRPTTLAKQPKPFVVIIFRGAPLLAPNVPLPKHETCCRHAGTPGCSGSRPDGARPRKQPSVEFGQSGSNRVYEARIPLGLCTDRSGWFPSGLPDEGEAALNAVPPVGVASETDGGSPFITAVWLAQTARTIVFGRKWAGDVE